MTVPREFKARSDHCGTRAIPDNDWANSTPALAAAPTAMANPRRRGPNSTAIATPAGRNRAMFPAAAYHSGVIHTGTPCFRPHR